MGQKGRSLPLWMLKVVLEIPERPMQPKHVRFWQPLQNSKSMAVDAEVKPGAPHIPIVVDDDEIFLIPPPAI
jgi:hypothetical protein